MKRVILACVCLSFSLAGCNTVQPPSAEVVSVALGEQTDEGGVVNITVRLTNPNDVELPLRDTRYRVELEGSETFAATVRPALSMPVEGEQLLQLSAAFSGKVAGRTAAVSGSAAYQPPGKIRESLTDMNVPLPTVSFSTRAALEN